MAKVEQMLNSPPKKPVKYVKEVWQTQSFQYQYQNDWQSSGHWVKTANGWMRRAGDPRLPEHYQEKKTEVQTTEGAQEAVTTPIAASKETVFLAYDWRCEHCRSWYSNKQEQEPSNGVCEDCAKELLERSKTPGDCDFCQTPGNLTCERCKEIILASYAHVEIPNQDHGIPD
jgi:hypothetical protein